MKFFSCLFLSYFIQPRLECPSAQCKGPSPYIAGFSLVVVMVKVSGMHLNTVYAADEISRQHSQDKKD